MYLCICSAVREIEIEQAIANGVQNFSEFRAQSGCSDVCGSCREDAEALFQKAVQAHRSAAKRFSLPILSQFSPA